VPATRLMSKAAVAYRGGIRIVEFSQESMFPKSLRRARLQMASYRTHHHWSRWVDPTSVLLECRCRLWDSALVENLHVPTNPFSGAILPAGIGCTSHWK
jgi:hypothetical protein